MNGIWRLRHASLIALAIAVMTSGCGDAEDGGSDAGLSTPPAVMVRDMIDTASTAKTRKDCKSVTAINVRSRAKLVCPLPLSDQRSDLNTIDLTAAAEYGEVGAVVDYEQSRSGKRRNVDASVLLVRDTDGRWSVAGFGVQATESVGSGDDEDGRKGSVHAVRQFLSAVREGDCRRFFAYTITRATEVRAACEELPRKGPFARFVRSNEQAQPTYRGGNATFAFHSVRGERDECFVISTMKNPEGSLRSHLVLGADAGPPGCGEAEG